MDEIAGPVIVLYRYTTLMFFRKSIKHSEFGTLKPYRDGTYWRARLHFAPVQHKVWVAIRAGSADSASTIDSAVVRMFQQIAEKYEALQHKMLKILHTECERGRTARPDNKWPRAEKADDLRTLVPLDEIWLEDVANKRFMFTYRSEVDKEHHIHLFFQNGKLENVASER